MEKTTIEQKFTAALAWVDEVFGRGFQKGMSDDTGISAPQINDCIKGRKSVSEGKRRLIVKKLPVFIDWNGTYDDFLNLGQWILLGNKGEDWPGVNHGSLKTTLPKPGFKFDFSDTPPPEPSNVGAAPYPPKQPHSVPIISWVQAGGWQDAENPFQPGQADEWVVTVETSSPRAFALIVRGDSMEPVFSEDDIITVDPDLDPRNHDYIVAKNGEEATFKQLVLDGSSVFLKPANTRYPIKDMTGVDFVIVGVVVEKRKKFR